MPMVLYHQWGFGGSVGKKQRLQKMGFWASSFPNKPEAPGSGSSSDPGPRPELADRVGEEASVCRVRIQHLGMWTSFCRCHL